MAKVIERWNPEDPATPVLIKPMMEDEHGPLAEREGVEKEAWEKACDYCLVVMREFNEDSTPPVSMSDLSDYVSHFMAGYLAAKTGELKLV